MMEELKVMNRWNLKRKLFQVNESEILETLTLKVLESIRDGKFWFLLKLALDCSASSLPRMNARTSWCDGGSNLKFCAVKERWDNKADCWRWNLDLRKFRSSVGNELEVWSYLCEEVCAPFSRCKFLCVVLGRVKRGVFLQGVTIFGAFLFYILCVISPWFGSHISKSRIQREVCNYVCVLLTFFAINN